jgi:alkanesulfonate monooxygenase SsuD/methylene tetrahydromethanopterin reductase-like flavin-dependent oxidoreductase (luciferase family)
VRVEDSSIPDIRSALWFPLFDELADPAVVVQLAVEAEERGWDGVFVWDHTRWRAPISAVAEAWITLAAVAAATERIRIGPMVTPLARRRPVQLARETVTLDLLSAGRLILGVGLGSDRFGGEYSLFGEETDDRRRAAMLDESLTILTEAWTGEPVQHHGEHYTVDGVQFLPTPAQDRIPIWVAGFPGKRVPLRRAARYDGYFPVNLAHPDQLAESMATLGPGYDVAVAQPAGTDLAPYVEAGATWWLTDFEPDEVSVDAVRGVLRDGPLSA